MTQAPPITLADFLLARIGEDKQRVRAGYPFDNWENHEDDYEWDSDTLMASWHTARCGHRYGERMVLAGEDCDCGVPTRVLAECEAKRRIVERHEPERRYDGSFYCIDCASHGCSECDLGDSPWPCSTLRDLATVYADHPAYRPEWLA